MLVLCAMFIRMVYITIIMCVWKRSCVCAGAGADADADKQMPHHFQFMVFDHFIFINQVELVYNREYQKV